MTSRLALLKEMVYMAIGEASVAWSELPKGTFETSKAEAIAERILAEFQKYENVVEAAIQHVRYAKEKQDCGPCFEYCPNAIDGEADCECGGSALYSFARRFDDCGWNEALNRLTEGEKNE